MHHALHRDARRKVLDKGRTTPMEVQGFSPDVAGWDPTWEHRFPELYGSDVRAAQCLLAVAGDPHGFPTQAWLFPCAGAPARIPSMAAVQIQWREVGSALELEATDWVAKGQPTLRDRQAPGALDALPPSKKAVAAQIAAFNAGKALVHPCETTDLSQRWQDLVQRTDPAGRDAPLRQIGT